MSSSDVNDYGVLGVLAKKLGLNDSTILKKALEYSRLTEAKSAHQPLGFSVSVQNIISLELAASAKGVAVDRALAIKLSGLSKKSYHLHLYNVEKLLEKQPASSVRDMCVRLGCMELQQSAERLLNRYKESNPFSDKDHPMYAAGALYTVAKYQKMSMDKQKLCDLGRTRPSKLDSLHTLMNKTLTQMGGVKKTALTKGPKNRSQALLERTVESNNSAVCADKGKSDETEEEDFEEWKRRMLSPASPVTNK